MRDQAQAYLSALTESTHDLIWAVDLDYRKVFFNDAFRQNIENSYGTHVEVGMRAEDDLPPERAALWAPLYDRVLREGPFRTEYSLVDGRTLELSLNPILVDGKAVGVSVFGKDVSERIAAEKALREAEKRYREIFDGAMEGIFRTSFDGRNLMVNPSLAKMLGYASPEEVVASVKDSAHDVWVHPDERARFLGLLEKQGVAVGYECQLKRKDGSTIWVSLSCRKVLSDDGISLINEGFVENISARKLAELQLIASEERFRATFEQAPIGILHVGLDTNILRCNRRLRRVPRLHSRRTRRPSRSGRFGAGGPGGQTRRV